MVKAVGSQIAAASFVLHFSEFHRAQCRVIERVLGNFDQIFCACSRSQLDLPFLPEQRDVVQPGLAHSTYKNIWAAQQQNLREKRIAPGQYREVLQHDGVEQ